MAVDQNMEWVEKALLDRPNAFRYLGAAGHNIGDSWSGSHVIRGDDARIQQVQSYNAQDHTKHGVADVANLEAIERYGRVQDIPGVREPIAQTAELVRRFFQIHESTSFTERTELLGALRSWFSEEVFALDPRFATRQSGGSAVEFARTGARVIQRVPPMRNDPFGGP